MCKACKMDDREMQVYYRRQGMVEANDFDDEVRYRHPKRRKKNKVNRRPGCPGNDYNKHVFVWEPRTGNFDSGFFFKYYGYYKKEYEVCCGCGKVGKSRRTEKYNKINLKKYTKIYGDEFTVKRGEPVRRYGRSYKPSLTWWSFEANDPEFKAAHTQWAIERGLPTWYYS